MDSAITSYSNSCRTRCRIIAEYSSVLATLITALTLLPNAQGEIIPASRLPTSGIWESAGVEGGIPPCRKIFAKVTDTPYGADNTGFIDATSAIQSAINDCPAGEAIFVPSGIYLISGHIKLKSDITLRGAGMELTTFDLRSELLMERTLGWPPPKVATPSSAI